MDLHQRKGGRIALPGTDISVRSCIPAFCPPGKQPCIPNKQMQDALIPVQHSSCPPQPFAFEQGPPAPQMIPHESLNQHQDIEYITLPVYKTRKNEPQPHYNQSDLSVLDSRFHQDNNPPIDIRTIQNITYPTIPEPHPPYFCLAQSAMRPRNPVHQEAQKFMAFQPPPRSPRREPTARALVSQHNNHFNYPEKEFEAKVDESMYYPKNFMVNIPGRRPAAEVQLPIPFQWVEINPTQNKPKLNQNPLMKPIPEKLEVNPHVPFRRCQDYEMFPDKPQQMTMENEERNLFKMRHVQDNYQYPANKKLFNDQPFNKINSTPIKSSYKIPKKKCFHKFDNKQDPRGIFPGEYLKKKFSSGRFDREGLHTDNYLSPLNFSTTSNSSLDSLSQSTHRSRNLKNIKCTCSEDSEDRYSTKKSRMSKNSPKSMCSVGNQTDFIKSPIEEKFLFRETILFGCDEIGKWARKLPMVSEISGMGDYIREKTTQSRAQNICSALGLEIEDQVIVSGYLKVFLKVADSWLEARNCFGLTENCMRKACQLNSPEISQNYLEWQHASRRLLGNIIHGVGSVLAPKEDNLQVNGPEVSAYPNQNVLFNFGANETSNGANKVDCRLTRSTSNLQKSYNSKFPPTQNKRPFLQRQKWTISDTASTTSQCSSGIRGSSQMPDLNISNIHRNYQNQPSADPAASFSSEPHPVLLSELPQHKITPLSQIEPPSLRKQENPCLTIDISAWFSGKSGDGVNRCLSSLAKESTLNMSRFSIPPPPLKTLPKPMNLYQKPMNIQKSQSVTVVYAANEGSQDSSDEIQQKIYMKPGSYNVPKKKLTNAKKRNNVQKAKEACCGDTDIPSGYIIPFVNAGPFVPPPSRGLQNPNIKIVKNLSAQSNNLINLGYKSEENVKIISKSDNNDNDKSLSGFDEKDSEERSIQKNEQLNQSKRMESSSKQTKLTTKTMKTDEWILSTLINSQVMRPHLGKTEEDCNEKADLCNTNTALHLAKSSYDKIASPSCILTKASVLQLDGQDKCDEKGQETSQDSQGHEISHSQASSDKSSHGIDENMTNRSQSSIASRSVSKSSKANKSVWHNSKRRRILSQRTFLRIQDVVNNLWNNDVPDYLKQAVKSPLTDYYKIVKYPVFLETITNKVKNGIYETVEQFVHDCRRLIFNSTLYFDKDKIEREKIKRFSEHLDKLMRETFENWECWNHITGDPREVNYFPELRYSNGCGFGKKRSKTPKNGSRKEEKLCES